MNKFIELIKEKYNLSSLHEIVYTIIPRAYNVPFIVKDFLEVKSLPDKTKVTTFGYIQKIEIKSFGRKLSQIKAVMIKDGERLNLQWVTSAQKAKIMLYSLEQKIGPIEKQNLIQVTGKVSSFNINGYLHKYLEQSQISRISEGQVSSTNSSVLIPEPLYKLTSGVKTTQVQFAIKSLLEMIPDEDFLPKELESKLNLQPLDKSLKFMHGFKPIPMEKLVNFLEYDGFIKRVQAEKIWDIVKYAHKNKNTEYIKELKYISDNVKKDLSKIESSLSFNLTLDQKRAIWKTLTLFSEKRCSNTLIFGDVGSGKTMVALFISKILKDLGEQVVILAPTSLLAEQHFKEAQELFGDENLFFVYSKSKKKEKDEINKILKSGEPAIVFGTSSVNKLEYTKLSCIFVDEEQKFGVKDKTYLSEKFNAHSVYMTATPIPRTLANAIYTDFEIQKIEQKPSIQKPRITSVVQRLTEQEIHFIHDRVKNYQDQALVIVPAIASSDMMSSAQAEIKYKQLFPDFKIGMINGRMKQKNIDDTTKAFMSGEIDMLIATTMVDSGFSNKKLSFVFIENAERFGISQMHQIRGRVGRAERQGYCYIHTLKPVDTLKDETRNRLLSMAESENGFDLSIKDMQSRGNGDMKGIEQSGDELNIIEWENEIKIMLDFLEN